MRMGGIIFVHGRHITITQMKLSKVIYTKIKTTITFFHEILTISCLPACMI